MARQVLILLYKKARPQVQGLVFEKMFPAVVEMTGKQTSHPASSPKSCLDKS